MAEYDDFAETYQKTNFKRPLFKFAVYSSFYNQFKNLAGKRILDLACGDGLVTRKLKKLGASEVTGMDISKKMIALAKETEQKEKLGIKYKAGQVGKLGKIGSFDYISAAFLLHYAKSKEELERMCEDCFQNLRKGGTLLAINNNPLHPLSKDRKYGNLIFCKNEPPLESDELFVRHSKSNISFKNYFWKKETYGDALSNAGFKKIEWLPIEVNKKGYHKMGGNFWKEFIEHPFFVIIKCVK